MMDTVEECKEWRSEAVFQHILLLMINIFYSFAEGVVSTVLPQIFVCRVSLEVLFDVIALQM